MPQYIPAVVVAAICIVLIVYLFVWMLRYTKNQYAWQNRVVELLESIDQRLTERKNDPVR